MEQVLETKTDVPTPARRLPGEEGIWIFILGDMTVFGLFFVTYAWYFAQAPDVFHASQSKLNQNFGAINTLLLLTSSLFVVLSLQAFRKEALKSARWFVNLAILCGLGFAGVKFAEYGEKIADGITLNTNFFYMFYYMYTGIHFLHVTIGIGILFFIRSRTRKDHITAGDISNFECGAIYWHMVDLLWIVLFPLLYLVR